MGWMVLALLLGIALGAMAAWLRGRRDAAHLLMAQSRCTELESRLAAAGGETCDLRERLSSSEKSVAGLTAQLEAARENLADQKKLLEDAQSKLRDAFASVSAEALAKNNEAFLQLARERFNTLSAAAAGSLDERKAQIEGMLKPMRELLDSYQVRLTEIERSRVESYSMLREQLGTLAETQRSLNTQTSQLVAALSRPTTRGQWGEISLRRLVELAGLASRCDFVEQGSVEGEDGRLRPDMVVHLPGGRQIIIDCKACLDAFLDAAAATDQDVRKVCLQRHSQQVRSRARELSAKAYWSQFRQSPEYVVMFLPGEAFLYAAVEADVNLIEDSLKSRVIVATPTTLIALLKAIEFGWRQETITENAEAIRKLGKELFDRIATLSSHFARLGATLDSAVESYNDTLGCLERRVLVSARKLGELGAGGGKDLSEPLSIEGRSRPLPAALTADE